MRARIAMALLVLAFAAAVWIVVDTAAGGHGRARRREAAGAQEVTPAPDTAGPRRATAIGKPACAPVRCPRRVPCRPVRRWRRSPSVGGSSSVSTRTPIHSALGTPLRDSWRASTSTSPARSRAASSAIQTASICGWSMPANGNPALQAGQVDLVVRTYSITCERKKKRRVLHDVLLRQPEHPRASRVRESIPPQTFRANGCARCGARRRCRRCSTSIRGRRCSV